MHFNYLTKINFQHYFNERKEILTVIMITDIFTISGWGFRGEGMQSA